MAITTMSTTTLDDQHFELVKLMEGNKSFRKGVLKPIIKSNAGRKTVSNPMSGTPLAGVTAAPFTWLSHPIKKAEMMDDLDEMVQSIRNLDMAAKEQLMDRVVRVLLDHGATAKALETQPGFRDALTAAAANNKAGKELGHAIERSLY